MIFWKVLPRGNSILPMFTAPSAIRRSAVIRVSAVAYKCDLRPKAHLKFPLDGIRVLLRAPMQAAKAAPLGDRRSYAEFLIFSQVRLRPDR